MSASTPEEHEDRFWALAEPMLDQPGATRSTMMGLPCLRNNGQFFASFDRRTGDLLVKLPEDRVAGPSKPLGESLAAQLPIASAATCGRSRRSAGAVPNQPRNRFRR